MDHCNISALRMYSPCSWSAVHSQRRVRVTLNGSCLEAITELLEPLSRDVTIVQILGTYVWLDYNAAQVVEDV